MNNIAIIPARSGSKGLIDKNIKSLCGKPLIAYTIEAALQSGCFETVMVSTDSDEYASIARRYGAEVPFLRSHEQSGDDATTWDTVREVLNKYAAIGKNFGTVGLLQPTSPLRNNIDIQVAFNVMEKTQANAVVGATALEHPLQWCFEVGEDLSLIGFAECELRKKRRQELPISYRLNGAIYLVDARKITNSKYDFYKDKCRAFIMSGGHSIDIDSAEDLALAEFLMMQSAQSRI